MPHFFTVDLNETTPQKTRDINLVLGQRLRRWPKIKSTSERCLVFVDQNYFVGRRQYDQVQLD